MLRKYVLIKEKQDAFKVVKNSPYKAFENDTELSAVDPIDPIGNVLRLIKFIDFKQNKNYIIFGVRNGLLIEAIHKNMTPNSVIVVIDYLKKSEVEIIGSDEFVKIVHSDKVGLFF